jgi:tetratricopeptide (TPR) repeat protein
MAMAFSHLHILALLGATLAASSIPALGATPAQNLAWCNNVPPASSDQQIAGCTALIQANARNPATLAPAFNNRGATFAERGDQARALADYSQAIAANPRYADAYNNRGNAYAALGDLARATVDYDEAIRLDPRHARAYYNRGIAHEQYRDHARAIADFDAALRLDPTNIAAITARGDAHGKMADYPKALLDYTSALRLTSGGSKPVIAELAKRRGFILLAQEDFERAIGDFRYAISNEPGDALSYHGRAAAYLGRGSWQAALDDLNQSIRLNPAYADAWHLRCMTRAMLGQRSADVWADCTEGQRREAGATYGLLAFEAAGIAALKLGEWKVALLQFDRGLLVHKDNARLRYGRGLARMKLGQSAAGKADIAEVNRTDPGVAMSFTHFGIKP